MKRAPAVRRTALVTGAGRGIGLAVAARLASAGHRLALIEIDPDTLSRAATALREGGAEVWTGAGDVAQAPAVAGLTREASAALGPITVLVNNAGIMGTSPLESCSDEEWARVLGVNLTGVFHLCRAVIPQMRHQGFGRIVNIASSAARDPRTITGAAYVASKAAVLALTRQLAYRLAPYRITVNAVAPGPIDTDMPRAAFPADVLQKAVDSLPLGRFGKAEEVAAAVAYLVSDEAAFVTGATIYLAGGAWIE